MEAVLDQAGLRRGVARRSRFPFGRSGIMHGKGRSPIARRWGDVLTLPPDADAGALLGRADEFDAGGFEG